MNVGRAIKILREIHEIKCSELAQRASISISMLSMIEKGQREPSLAALRRIAVCLDIPLDVLLAATQPGEGTLTSSNDKAHSFASALKRLETLEEEIREMTIREISV